MSGRSRFGLFLLSLSVLVEAVSGAVGYPTAPTVVGLAVMLSGAATYFWPGETK